MKPRRHLVALAVLTGALLALTAGSVPAQTDGTTVRLIPAGHLHGVPEGRRELGPLIAVTYSPEQGLIVLEKDSQRLILADDKGLYREETGGFGFGNGTFRGATDVSVAGFETWVSDPPAGIIHRFDRWLAPLDPFENAISQGATVAFDRPVSVARANSGDITVLEKDRADALLIDPDGRLVDRIAAFGDIGGSLAAPRRVEVNGEGGIAIADPGRRTVILLDRFGSYRGQRSWTLEGGGPTGVAWQNGHLWVCGETGVVLYDVRGAVLKTWPTATFGGPPHDLAVRGDRLAVAAGTELRLFRVVMDGR